MMQDLNLQFDYQFAATTKAASTYTVDLVAAGDAMPNGSMLIFKALVTTAFTGTISSFILQLQTADDTAFNTNAATLAASTTITSVSTLTAGYVFTPYVVPFGVRRYLRAYYNITGNTAITAGKLTTQLVLTTDKLLPAVLSSTALFL